MIKICYTLILLFLTEIASAKTYNVVVDGFYPPFSFLNEKGEIIGLEVDILNAIARDRGLSFHFYYHNWDSIFDELGKSADIIAGGAVPSEVDTEIANITHSYLISNDCIGYLKQEHYDHWPENSISISETEPVLADTLRQRFHVSSLEEVASPFLALREVVIGHKNIVAADCTLMKYYSKSPTFLKKGYQFIVTEIGKDNAENTSMVFAVRKDNSALLDEINTGLKNIESNRYLNNIFTKWRVQY